MTSNQDPKGNVRRRRMVVRVNNEPGILARIVGLISGRGWNIDSLAVYQEPNTTHARITLVFMATDMLAEQIGHQIGKLVPVNKVFDLTDNSECVEIMTVLVRLVTADSTVRNRSITEANQHGARLQAQTDRALIFSKTGTEIACNEFVKLMGEFGEVNSNGTGVTAID